MHAVTQACRRRDIDDGATATHRLDGELGRQHHPAQVEIQHPQPVIGGSGRVYRPDHCADVVDQDIQAAQYTQRGGHHCPYVVQHGQVNRDEPCAELPGGVLSGCRVPVGDQHHSALGAQPARHGPPDPGGTAGHHRPPALQSLHRY